jgi:hypothetical protein
LEIMRHQRETWVMLMEKLTKERAGETSATVAANADAVSHADVTQASVAAAVKTVPVAGLGRRGYPAFAVRPETARETISVQG